MPGNDSDRGCLSIGSRCLRTEVSASRLWWLVLGGICLSIWVHAEDNPVTAALSGDSVVIGTFDKQAGFTFWYHLQGALQIDGHTFVDFEQAKPVLVKKPKKKLVLVYFHKSGEPDQVLKASAKSLGDKMRAIGFEKIVVLRASAGLTNQILYRSGMGD